MKPRFLFTLSITLCLLGMCLPCIAEEIPTRMPLIPADDFHSSVTIYDAMTMRHSSRDFENQELSVEDISKILWAAAGINRPEKGLLTIPTALNRQNLLVYLFNAKGVWTYEPKEHVLIRIRPDDLRAMTGMQDWVSQADINLVYVGDISAYDEHGLYWSYFHAGLAAQNVGLVCAAENLKNVVRGSVETAPLAATLGLPDNLRILMTQSIGK